MPLDKLVSRFGLPLSAEEILSLVHQSVNESDATASSLARSLADRLGVADANAVISGPAQADTAQQTRAIIDELVKSGVLRFEGRRPVIIEQR